MILDSDERVSNDIKKEIKSIITKPHNNYNAYLIPYQNHVFGKPVYWGGEDYKQIKLFLRCKGSVDLFPIHEDVHVYGKIGELNGLIEHYSYRTIRQLFSKFTLYAKIAAQEKYKKGEKASIKSLIFNGLHMFWARYIKDHGYRDGWRGFVLASAFAYMEQMTYFYVSALQLREK